jgi:DeoR family glycerol-3-phosphate regulon repressor
MLHEPTFLQRMNVQRAAKDCIAGQVATMIDDGDSVILDIGSTTAYVARAFKNHRDLYVVTDSVAVALILAPRNGSRVFLAGCELRAHDGGAFGVEAHAFVRRFGVRHAALSVAAIDGIAGFMLHNMQKAALSRTILEQAERVIVAADSTKFERRVPAHLIDSKVVDYVVTDAPPPPTVAALLEAAGVEIVLAAA